MFLFLYKEYHITQVGFAPEVCSSESIKDDFVGTNKEFVFADQTLMSSKQDDTFSCSNALKSLLSTTSGEYVAYF